LEKAPPPLATWFFMAMLRPGSESNTMITVEQFCAVCTKNLKMTVVGNNPDEDYIWCKCPDCRGIAPYPRSKATAVKLSEMEP
jgi:hypothetical protein